MTRRIEFLYDFTSPNAYLAYKVLPGIAAQNGAEIDMHPVLLGGIFNGTGNQSPIFTFADVPAKLNYLRLEMARFVERHKVPFTMNSHFPVHPVASMRAAMFARNQPWEAAFTNALFNAAWVTDENIGDPAVMEAILLREGLPADAIMAATLEPEIKHALKTVTDAAIARGAFGAPTMFIDDAMFFGKDSLSSVDDYLAGRITR